jgi:hypothetical protein
MAIAESSDTIMLRREVPFGAITFEQRPPNMNGLVYRRYHIEPGANGAKRSSLVSVSTVVGCMAKPELDAWREDRTAAAVVTAHQDGALDGVAPDDAGSFLRSSGRGAEAIMRAAADRGTFIHALIDGYLTTGEVPNPAEVDPEFRPYLRAALRWMLDAERAGMEVEATERIVAHPEHLYAGRLDLRYHLADGLPRIVDFKTNEKGRVYGSHHYQPMAYGLADEACGAEPIVQGGVVALGADGLYEQRVAVAKADDFLALLGAYRTNQRVEAAARRART